jgi:hypothetical protein
MNELITKVQAYEALEQEIYDYFETDANKELILEYLHKSWGSQRTLSAKIKIKCFSSTEVEIYFGYDTEDNYYIPILLFIDKQKCYEELEKEMEDEREREGIEQELKFIEEKQKRERLYNELKKEFGND